MSQLLELVWVKSTAYTANPTEFEAVIKANFAGLEGVVARYKGTNTAVPDEHVFINIWSTEDHFDAAFAKMKAAGPHPLKDYFDSQPKITSVSLNGADYTQVLSSPVVSFSYATPKEGVTRETIAPIIEKIIAYQDSAKASTGFLRGQVHEQPGTFLSVSGWESVEAHHAAVKAEGIAPILAQFRENLSEHEVKDVKLTSFNY